MPKHLRLWIMWSSQQDYRQIVFMVFIWQMGKLRPREAGSWRGQLIIKLWRQASLILLFSSSEWFRFQCAEESPTVYSKCGFLKLILKGTDVMALEWVREICIYDKTSRGFSHRWSTNHMSTGELQMTELPSCGFSPHPPSLVEGGKCYLRVLASVLLPGTRLPSPGFLLLKTIP